MFLLKTLASGASPRRDRTTASTGIDDIARSSSRSQVSPRSGRTFSLKGFGRIVMCLFALTAFFASPVDTFAADGRGTVSGKIINQSSGAAVSSARIRVVGTSLSTVSEVDGQYRLRGVPAGEVELFVEYGSSSSQKVTVVVGDGQTVLRNVGISLAGTDLGQKDVDDGIFELAPFEVQMQGEFNAFKLATNEERYSVSMKDVVAADQFGDNTDGNLGEFIKNLPGVNVIYGAGAYGNGADAGAVGIRGFGAEQTAIMVDGVEISGSDPGSLTRAVALDMISVNNASRIEVSKLPTADMPDGATGGSINLVTRSAFEYPKAQFNWRTYLSLNSDNLGNFFSKTPGPTNKATYKTIPGFDFSYVKPINEKFGITVNGQFSQQYNENHTSKSQWDWDGSKKQLAGDRIGEYAHVGSPFLKTLSITDAPRLSTRTAFGLKADWRPTEDQTVSFRIDRSEFEGTDSTRRLQLSPGTPSEWGSNGDGTGYVIAKTNSGKAAQDVDFLDREGHTNNFYVNYKLDRGPWKVAATFSKSLSKSALESTKNGHMSGIELSSGNIADMTLGNITEGIPTEIYLTSEDDGGAYNMFDLSNYSVNSLSEAEDGGTTLFVKSGQSNSSSTKETYKIDVTRDLDFLSNDNFRLAAKAGVYRKVQEETKGGRGINYRYRYIGPVDAFDASVYEDTSYVEQDPGFGFLPMSWVDPYKIYDFFSANPNYFSDTEDVVANNQESVASRNYNEEVQTSKSVTETNDAYYLQLEGKAFNNKLTFVGGVRWSESSREGYGPYQNKDWKFLQNADGTVFYYEEADSNGVIQLKAVDVSQNWVTKYSEDVRQQLVDAGFMSSIDTPNTPILDKTLAKKQREYVKNYPIDENSKTDPTFSFQTSYEISKRLKARLGYAKANGAPDYEGSYGILQRVTFDFPTDGNDTGKITIGNPALEPWRSDKYDFQLAYYTDLGGKIKVSYFIDETENYVVNEDYIMTSLADLESFDLPANDEYLYWTVTTQRNGEGTSKTTGYEVEVNQSLGFLGDFGNKFQVYGSYSTKETEKDDDANLSDSPKDSSAFGVYFNAGRFSARVSATYQSELITKYTKKNYHPDPLTRNDRQSIQLYYRTPSEMKVDLNLNYQLNDRYGIFYSARNVTNTQSKKEIFDEEGLLPDYVNMEAIRDFGFNMQLGLRGSF